VTGADSPATRPARSRRPPRRRVRTPTVLQMEALECGAAALGSVLAYHGRWVPLEELRYECGVSRDGSKASYMLRAARKYGLECSGFRVDSVESLYDQPLPIILFWNLNHFVVLEGFGRGRAYLNDPAEGPRAVPMDEFDGAFSGVFLTFRPGPDFHRGGTPPKMAPALRRRLRGSESALFYAVLCGLLLVIPGLVIPTFTRVFVDEYLIGAQEQLVKPLLGAMAAAVLVQAVLAWLQKACLLRLETKLAVSTSSQFFTHALRLPAVYFAQRFAGEIGSRVLINDKVADVVSRRLAGTAIDSVMTLLYAGLMFTYDVRLTLVVILIALLDVGAVMLSRRLRTDTGRRVMQERGKLTGTAMNGLQMIETIKATGSEDEFFARWAGYYAKTVNAEQSAEVLAAVSGLVPPFVQTLSSGAVLVLGGLSVMNGRLSVGMLVAYQALLANLVRPLTSFVQFGAGLQELQADMNRLDDVLDHPQDRQYEQEGDAAPFGASTVKLSGRVELRDVTFGYVRLDKPLIKGFNLKVEPGRRVAIVGASGSGKSTVAKLIAGLYEPWSGEILFDGVPRRQVPRRLIVNSLAVVDQEAFLFDGTVADNIALWDSTLALERIGRAATDAAIDEVITAREGGYQGPVQEGGGNFSGGECQRMEIARALVAEPSIVVLDEATAALDPATEALVDRSLRRRGCTCIIIAHRLSTIRDCDEIVVLEQGQILQRGTHDEMKHVDGPYRRLISTHDVAGAAAAAGGVSPAGTP
jgi:NHLM bacteriocin system ABC transporter peptidase/ATP-binding protein